MSHRAISLTTLVLSLVACGCSDDPAPAGSGGTHVGGGGVLSGSGGSGAMGTGAAASTGGNTGGSNTGGQLATLDCASLPLCTGFEQAASGSPPEPSIWTPELFWDGNGDAAAVTVDNQQAHTGVQSLRVAPPSGGPWGASVDAPGNSVLLRAWIRVDSPEAAGVLVGIGTSHGDEVRLRLKDGKITLNHEPASDGLNPDPATCTDCVATPSDWFCAEMYFDVASQTATIWIDGVQAAHVAGGSGWHNGGTGFSASASRVWFGSFNPNGTSPTVSFDDIALAESAEVTTDRLGCD